MRSWTCTPAISHVARTRTRRRTRRGTMRANRRSSPTPAGPRRPRRCRMPRESRTMSPSADVIVVGLGAMGAAAARALSRRGLRVLGFDRFAPPHALGSSHGDSRIIREAYFEHPAYVPLVQRAYLLWEELERESGQSLLTRTGGIMIGPRDGELVAGALRSATMHALPHKVLDASEISIRVPAFRPHPDWVGVFEPNDGVLRPEAGIAAMLAGATRHGARLRTDEPIVAWRGMGDGVLVTTARGTYHAAHVVLAA